VVELVELIVLAKLISSKNWIFGTYVCRKQWLNWLIRQNKILANSNFRIVCVAGTIEMVDLPFFAESFLTRHKLTHTCASSGWIGWIAYPRKINFSRNWIFGKYVCRKQWLNWLICQNKILANSNFRIVCVAGTLEMVDLPFFAESFLTRLYITHTCASSGWNGWINNPRKSIFSPNLIFTNMYVANSGWIGWFTKIRFSQTQIF
jgi:hypothetical protein